MDVLLMLLATLKALADLASSILKYLSDVRGENGTDKREGR